MPSTDSFTSSALVTTVGTAGTFAYAATGQAVYTLQGFYIKVMSPEGVTITKATSFGGSQTTLTFPITLDQARDLAVELLKAVT